MAAMTDYLETALINHIFRGTAYTGPGTIYVGLLTAAPTASTTGTEVTGGSYARVGVSTAGGTNWAATSSGNGTTSNVNAVTWASAPTASWGVVTHFALYDAASAGNMLFYGALSASKTINNGDAAPSFAAGALTVQIDN